MAFKLIVLAAFVAVARAGVISGPAPLAYAAAPAYAHAPVAYAAAPALAKTVVDTDFDPNPSYSYAYDVQDALTGDSKNQHESRQGDVVQGSYSLTEPDGTRRTVEYTADPINGFNAVVHKEGLHVKAVAAAPVAYAAPIAKVAAPVAYAAPAYAHAAPLAYSAPIAKVAAPVAYAAPAYAHAAPLAYSAPIAKVASPLSYAAPAYAHASPLAYAHAPAYYH